MIIDPLPRAAMLEVLAVRPLPASVTFTAEWPVAPGAVFYGTCGRPVVLHCASGRWLVSTDDAVAEKLVRSTSNTRYCQAIDVTGKWLGLRLFGVDVERILASSADTGAMLDGRRCASTTLFDCPVVIAKGAGDYYVWVQRSYATDLVAALSERSPSSS